MNKPYKIYQTKLGTVPYANVESRIPLQIGQRFYLPKTSRFTNVRLVKKPKYKNEFWSVEIDRIDGDVLFLTRN